MKLCKEYKHLKKMGSCPFVEEEPISSPKLKLLQHLSIAVLVVYWSAQCCFVKWKEKMEPQDTIDPSFTTNSNGTERKTPSLAPGIICEFHQLLFLNQ